MNHLQSCKSWLVENSNPDLISKTYVHTHNTYTYLLPQGRPSPNIQHGPHMPGLLDMPLQHHLVQVQDQRGSLLPDRDIGHSEVPHDRHLTLVGHNCWISDLEGGGDGVAINSSPAEGSVHGRLSACWIS